MRQIQRMEYSRINAELLRNGRVADDDRRGGVRARRACARALGAGDDRCGVKRREGDAARGRCQRLREAARYVPCHCGQERACNLRIHFILNN